MSYFNNVILVHGSCITCTRRFPVKYTKEERLEVGCKIYHSGLSNLKAAEQLGISEESARRYRILYEESQGLEHRTGKSKKESESDDPGVSISPIKKYPEEYSSMSKEELLEELMQSKIREARLKKGYMVKGVGADKEYILLGNKNTK